MIGGGSASSAWIAILASVLGITLHRLAEGAQGAAFGAARLARLAATGETPETVCTPPHRLEAVSPDLALVEAYAAQQERYRALYPAFKTALS